MASIDQDELVEKAQKTAFDTLKKMQRVQLNVALIEDGWYVVTSPDADWLIVMGPSRDRARRIAMLGLLRVAHWCGADFRLPGG